MRVPAAILDLSDTPIDKLFSSQMNPTLVINVFSKVIVWSSPAETFSHFLSACIAGKGMNRLRMTEILNASKDFFPTATRAYSYCKLNPKVSYSGVFSIRCDSGQQTGILFTARLADHDDPQNPNLFFSFVALGDHFAASSKYQSLVNNTALKAKKVISLLTNRELDVLRLISHGKTTKEIATILFISTHTVDTHKNKLYQKLNVRNTAQLGKMAERYGLSDND